MVTGLILRVGGPTETVLRQQQIQIQQQQAESQRIAAESRALVVAETKRAEEARLNQGFQVGVIEKATKNKPKSFSGGQTFTIREFGSLAAAERAARARQKILQVALRGEQIEVVRIKKFADKPIFKGSRVIGGFAGSGTTPRQRQRQRLGLQAIQKASKNIPISAAERSAARRLTGVTVQSKSQTARLTRQKRLVEQTKEEVVRVRGIAPTVTPKKPLEVITRERLEKIKEEEFQRRVSKLTRRVEAERFRREPLKILLETGVEAAKDIRTAFFGTVGKAEQLFTRPIGRVRTGFEEFTREVTREGRILREERVPVLGPKVLFPIIPEQAAKIARGAESALKFIFETVPRAVPKVPSAVKQFLEVTGKPFVKEVKKRPVPTLIIGGAIVTAETLKIIKETTGAFRREPVFIAAEAITFGTAIGSVQLGFKPVTARIARARFERRVGIERLRPGEPFKPIEVFEPVRIIERKRAAPPIVVAERLPGFIPVTGIKPKDIIKQLQLVPKAVEKIKPIEITPLKPPPTPPTLPVFERPIREITARPPLQRFFRIEEAARFPRQLTIAELREITTIRGLPIRERQAKLTEFLRRRRLPVRERRRPGTVRTFFRGKKGQAGLLQFITPPKILERLKPRIERPRDIFEELRRPLISRPILGLRRGLLSELVSGIRAEQFLITRPLTIPVTRAEIAFRPLEPLITPEALRLDALLGRRPITDITTKLRQQLRLEPRLESILELRPRVVPKISREKIVSEEVVSKIPRLFRIKLGLPAKKRAGVKKRAFEVQVREGERKRDRFIPTGGKTLPRLKAINRGARITDQTTAASFRIKRKGTTTQADDLKFFLERKFRARRGKTKLPPRTFVEKSKFRIDSFGERLGIPFSPTRIPRLRQAIARRARALMIQRGRIPRPLTTGPGRVMRFL
ncbi:MAG: hypothetical protein IH934_04615 [Nanoarchaeota archaeon]|nr:hypothetical protein [Nanoarchaeota archaeon]